LEISKDFLSISWPWAEIHFFLEDSPARLPLFVSLTAQLAAQHAACLGPAGGLHHHGAKAETKLSSSPVREKSSPNLIFNRIHSKSKQKTHRIGACILHELLGEKSLYKEASRPNFWIKIEPPTLASHQLTAVLSEDFLR
jgi:hypothetical protein